MSIKLLRAASCSSPPLARMFALSSRRPLQERQLPTFYYESQLPRLPVPRLRDTLDAYLTSLLPFYDEKGRDAPQCRAWVDELEGSELGQELQRRVEDLDRTAPSNWLDDSLWLRVAYHSSRTPLPIHSNWWLLAAPDATLEATTGQSDAQLARAAHLVNRFLEFKTRIDRQDIPPDSSRTGPFCMHQYRRICGVTRLPGVVEDSFAEQISTRHITVICCEQLYSMLVLDSDDTSLSSEAMVDSLAAIRTDACARSDADLDQRVSSLTAADRAHWAGHRDHLISLSASNRAALQSVESSLFVLSLDDWSREAPRSSSRASHLLGDGAPADAPPLEADLRAHILNASAGGPTPGRSRWFDKSINMSVERDGRASVNGEHSPCEALIPAIAVDYALAEPTPPSLLLHAPRGTQGNAWARLRWKTDERIHKAIAEAERMSDAAVADSDAAMLWADEYGTDFIKAVAKQPPDAYIQMALQLAYRRMHGRYTAVYETASTRLFLHGRTDTIRSFTSESRKFCEAMLAGSRFRYALLSAACARHLTLTREASLGRGVDRHLLALRLLTRPGEPTPRLFEDPLFSTSQDWRLSTSGLSAGDRFHGTGFGAPLPDGYGINYLAGKDMIKFGIESKHSSTQTNTSAFRSELAQVLREMRVMCEEAAAQAIKEEAKL